MLPNDCLIISDVTSKSCQIGDQEQQTTFRYLSFMWKSTQDCVICLTAVGLYDRPLQYAIKMVGFHYLIIQVVSRLKAKWSRLIWSICIE